MSHIEVLRELYQEQENELKYLNEISGLQPISKNRYALVDSKLQVLSYAIKCCEIVEGLPSEEEIERIVNDHCRKIIDRNKAMFIYGTLAKALSKRIRGEE